MSGFETSFQRMEERKKERRAEKQKSGLETVTTSDYYTLSSVFDMKKQRSEAEEKAIYIYYNIYIIRTKRLLLSCLKLLLLQIFAYKKASTGKHYNFTTALTQIHIYTYHIQLVKYITRMTQFKKEEKKTYSILRVSTELSFGR